MLETGAKLILELLLPPAILTSRQSTFSRLQQLLGFLGPGAQSI
jgi:hypothetical protein